MSLRAAGTRVSESVIVIRIASERTIPHSARSATPQNASARVTMIAVDPLVATDWPAHVSDATTASSEVFPATSSSR